MSPNDYEALAVHRKTGVADSRDEQLLETVSAAQRISRIRAAAQELREKAAQAVSAPERERLLNEAYEREIEAHGSSSKLARRLRSGTWQGLAGGAGIGGGVAAGLGAVVGTLVGGVLAIPTTSLGALVGGGVGAVHGPFIRVKSRDGEQGKTEEKRWDEASPDEVVNALKLEAEERSGISHDDGQDVREPLRIAESCPSKQEDSLPREKKKPRKLEIRSHPAPEGKWSKEGKWSDQDDTRQS